MNKFKHLQKPILSTELVIEFQVDETLALQ